MRTARSFSFFAALALVVSTSNVSAQSTFIYWRNSSNVWPSPSIHYKYPVRATSAQFNVFPTETAAPSTLSTYPAGRQFLSDYVLDPALFGTIPGTNSPLRVNLLLPERAGGDGVLLTLFFGPEFQDQSDLRWSSNNTDSFLSFQSLDPFANQRRVYRYNGSKTALFSPSFVPFDQTDILPPTPRLVLVTSFSADSFTNDWNSAGNRLMFSTPAPFGHVTRVRNTVAATTTVVNNPATSGFTLINPVFSPTNPNLAFAVAQTTSGLRGLASFDIATLAFRWILLEGGIGTAKISTFKGPQVSPDGNTLVFTMLRMAKVGTQTGPAPTLATIPVAGGTPTVLWTTGLSTNQWWEPTGWINAP